LWIASLLSRHPYLGPARGDLRPGLRSFSVGGYVIVYRVEDEDAVMCRTIASGANDAHCTIRRKHAKHERLEARDTPDRKRLIAPAARLRGTSTLKMIEPSRKKKKIKVPGPKASYDELADFFEQHDGIDLLEQGIMEIDPDHSDLEAMLLDYWKQPNSQQLNIQIPKGGKKMIERLAKRKTVEVSTLVRMWVVDGMRREASQP
jgi:hypothetical protein